MYINFYQYFSPHFDINKKAARTRFNCPGVLEELIFLGHTFYIFVEIVVMKTLVYLLIENPLLYENIVNLFAHDIET